MAQEYIDKIDDDNFMLGQNGELISLGDRALICLIRVLLSEPDVLVR